MPDPLLTADDLAARFRVKRRTVYDLVRNHGLPALRLGVRCMRFKPDAVDAWVEAQQEAETTSWQRPLVAFSRTR